MFQKNQAVQNKQKLVILQTISPILNKYESQRKKVAFWSIISTLPIIVFYILGIVFALGILFLDRNQVLEFVEIWGKFHASLFESNFYLMPFYALCSLLFGFPFLLSIFFKLHFQTIFAFILFSDFRNIPNIPIGIQILLILISFFFIITLFFPLSLISILQIYLFRSLMYSPQYLTQKILGKKFRQNFKNEVIPKVLEIANCGLIYQPFKKLEKKKIVESCLFWKLENEKQEPNSQFLKSQNPNYQIETEDFMTEIVPKFGLQICEIHIKNPDFHPRSLISKKLISNGFQGLFISANFVNSFANEAILTTPLFLFPPNFLMTSPQDANGEFLPKVILESPVFARNFEVFGDQLEARLVLQTDIMDRLNFLKEKYKRPILVSFIDDKLSIAVEFGTDLFEPTIFVPSRIDLIEEFVQTVEIIQDLVVCLKLRKLG